MSLRDSYAMRDEAREEAYRRNGICNSNDPLCSCPVCHDGHVFMGEVEENAQDMPLDFPCCIEAMRNKQI